MNNNDLKRAYEAITRKNAAYRRLFQYYDGDQPLVFASERLREIFSGVDVRFTENWCAVVIDSVKDRMELSGLNVPDEYQKQMDTIWQANELDLEADAVHEAALTTGEAFVIAWPDEETEEPCAYYNDPRLCHVFYGNDNPRQARYAAKLWGDNDGYARLTLYYPDRLEYYRSSQKAENMSSAAAFQPMDLPSAPNPYSEIPVFHFRLFRRGSKSDLTNIVPLQNGINKLMSDMMVAAEYGAFKQRYIISNVDVSMLRNAPNEIWSIPAGDGVGQAASAGQFDATDLKNYLEACAQLAGDIGRISRTPKHYFYSQGGDPSGEALLTMEAPLIKKVNDRIKLFTPVWQRLGAFLLRLGGVEINPVDVRPQWLPVETVQPYTEAQIRLLDVQAGMPLITSLRRSGWSDAEIEQMEAERETSGAQIGDQILSNFEKGQ
jgi:hypothetical protein